MDDREIKMTANQMIWLFAADAATYAAMRADDLLEQGDDEGFEAWTQVMLAINEMRGKARSGKLD